MTRRIIAGAAAALALASSAVVLNAGTASATRCHGVQVVTCTYVVFPQGGSSVYARATVTDANDGVPFDVKVEYARLERRVNGGPWEGVRWMHDLDGWHDNYDEANANPDNLYVCGPGTEVRSVATFHWRRTGETSDPQYGDPIPCGRSFP